MALAMVAPAPGSTPTTKPIRPEERTMVHQVMAISLALNKARPVTLIMPWIATAAPASAKSR
jgi:hypothetical protein